MLKNALFLSIENSEGKYISPFHDIPIYANEVEVSVMCQVNAAVFRALFMPLLLGLYCIHVKYIFLQVNCCTPSISFKSTIIYSS